MTSVAFWRRYDEMEARLTRPVSERMLDMGGPLMQLVEELPWERRQAWKDAVCRAAEKHRAGGMIALGGVTRITLARKRE